MVVACGRIIHLSEAIQYQLVFYRAPSHLQALHGFLANIEKRILVDGKIYGFCERHDFCRCIPVHKPTSQ